MKLQRPKLLNSIVIFTQNGHGTLGSPFVVDGAPTHLRPLLDLERYLRRGCPTTPSDLEDKPVLYFRYRSTNCFFVRSSLNGRLLAIDAGWPGTLYEYARGMKTIGCNLENVAWAMVTHFHMDHAGLISEFVTRGVKCFVFEHQLGAIDAMEKTIEKNDKTYKRIDKTKLHLIKTQESRERLEEVGIHGQVVVTDYHSSDSITFITVQGEALVGDLPPEAQMMPDDHRLRETWEKIRKVGARTIYPSHAGSIKLKELS